jgi:hypothetical protein
VASVPTQHAPQGPPAQRHRGHASAAASASSASAASSSAVARLRPLADLLRRLPATAATRPHPPPGPEELADEESEDEDASEEEEEEEEVRAACELARWVGSGKVSAKLGGNNQRVKAMGKNSLHVYRAASCLVPPPSHSPSPVGG